MKATNPPMASATPQGTSRDQMDVSLSLVIHPIMTPRTAARRSQNQNVDSKYHMARPHFTMNSMRRFFALFSAVSFGATGMVWP